MDDDFLKALAEGGFQVGELAKFMFCEDPIAENITVTERKYEEALKVTIEMIASKKTVIAEAAIKLSQLDAIAFGCGPGSFTGVRIATSVTKGLAFGANLPVIPISTLRALAQGAFTDFAATKVLAIIDARMHEVYFGMYELINGIMQKIILAM